MKVRMVILSLSLFISGLLSADIGDITISPNPANHSVTIFMDSTQKTTIEVYSVIGKKVLSTSFYGNSKTLDVHLIPNGLYLVSIRCGDNRTTRRLKINH